jgi:general L-amino acid transport system substrate-binding protein
MTSRGSTKHWRRAVGAVAALALIAGACGGDDDDEGAEDTAVESEDTTAGTDATDDTSTEETTTEDTSTEETTTDDTVDVTQGGSTLDAVRERGTVRCGSNDSLPGFGVVDPSGAYSGFDIDYCRAVAAGVLGDSEAVEYVPLTAEQRFTALQAGEIDVLIRNTTATATRDGSESATFLFTTFYDGQGMMVPASTGYTTLEDLADASICVLSGTTTELNLNAVFSARGIAFNPVVFEDDTQLRPAYEEGQCEAWTTDSSALASWKSTIEGEGGEEQLIMSEIISKEPLGPTVLDGDSAWAQAVEWSVMATVQAWEFGLDSSNIGSYAGEDPNILNFLGADGFDPGLNLSPTFAIDVVTQVGNYQEIYLEHIEPLGLTLEGSVNDLWSNGGLMYVPPYR